MPEAGIKGRVKQLHPTDTVACNRPISQIPKCICAISHNATFCDRNVHMCAHLLQNGALWDICLVHCGICEIGLLHVPALDTSFWHNIPELIYMDTFPANATPIVNHLHYGVIYVTDLNYETTNTFLGWRLLNFRSLISASGGIPI